MELKKAIMAKKFCSLVNTKNAYKMLDNKIAEWKRCKLILHLSTAKTTTNIGQMKNNSSNSGCW